jgi:hypothetical protein
MRTMVSAVLLLAIGWLTSGPSAQGLGEVARREADRRQQTNGGKKYTNDDLRAIPGEAAPVAPSSSTGASAPAGPSAAGSSSAAAPGEASEATGAAAPADAAKPRADVKTAEQKRGEQYWREKAGTIRAELDKTANRVDGLKKRLQSLEEQLSNGAGTSHVQERDVTLQALEKAQNNAKSIREEWDRLEGRAKSEKVPADWLR